MRVHRVVQAVVCGRMGQTAGDLRERLVAYAVKRGELLIEGWVDRTARWEIDPLHKLATQLLEFEVLGGGRLANRVFRPVQLLGELPEARTTVAEGRCRRREALGARTGDLAISYSNLALVEQDWGSDRSAAPAAQGRRHRREEPPPEYPLLAIRYSNLATVERELGDLIAARWLLRRSVAIGEKHLVARTPFAGNVLLQLGIGGEGPGPLGRSTPAAAAGHRHRGRSTSVPKIPFWRPTAQPRADRAEAG